MSFIAIIGAGPIGGSLAQKLAQRSKVGDVRLIDSAGAVARGKALDILQSAPIEGFSARVTAADSINAAAGADAIILADHASGQGEHNGEAGLALVRQLRSEEHTSELQSRLHLVCRLLLEKKKKKKNTIMTVYDQRI